MGKAESGLFEAAAASLTGMPWRPELIVEEIPAPQRIAPFAVAISAEVEVDDAEIGQVRLILLHDPAESDSSYPILVKLKLHRGEIRRSGLKLW